MKKGYIFIFLIFLLLIAGGYIYWKSIKTSNSSQQNNQTKKQRVLPKEVTVRLDKKGFSPAVVTVEVGSAVRWKNVSGDKQTVNSDDYPSNQLHRELNFGVFNDGSTVVYTFTKPGTYGYHNQFKPEQKGKVIVEK